MRCDVFFMARHVFILRVGIHRCRGYGHRRLIRGCPGGVVQTPLTTSSVVDGTMYVRDTTIGHNAATELE